MSEEFKEILQADKVLFLFECENCHNKIHIDVFEILNSGTPLCCDEEMEIDDGAYYKFTC